MTDRRDFIRMGAGVFFIAGAGRSIGALAPSNRLRFAIIGCREGARGFSVVKAMMDVPGVEIAVVCDVDSRAMDFCADWLVKAGRPMPRKEKDFRKVIEMSDVDGIVSETPDHFHAYSAVMAMRAGKHVYVEKPCAYCPAELEVIRRVWKETGMVFQQGSQRRSTPAYIEAIPELRSVIGEPHWGRCWYNTRRKPIGCGQVASVPEWLDWDLWQGPAPREAFRDNLVPYNWHWFRKWGTGEVGNNQVHFADIARWVLGVDYPERVVSGGGRYWMPDGQDWQWPDTQIVSYEFPGRKFLSWEGTCCVNSTPFMGVSTGVVVYGEAGSAFFAPNGSVTAFDTTGKAKRKWGVQADAAQVTNTDNRAGGSTNTTTLHFGNFAQAIRDNRPLDCAAHADIAVRSSFLALAGNIAQTTGETLKVDPSTGRILSGGRPELWTRTYEKGWEVV